MKNYERYAPLIARLGVGLVFLTFGIWQITKPESWLGYLPGFIFNSGISISTFLTLNGMLDTVIGLGLLLGIFVRTSSALGILHLIGIISSLGWNDVSVRDFGLMIVLISIFLRGGDNFSLGKKIMKKH